MQNPADLLPWRFSGVELENVLGVGWLDSVEPAPKSSQREVFRQLAKLLQNPWQPTVALGHHACRMCRFSPGPTTIVVEGVTIEMGRNNVFVPDGERVFVAPSLILHYMDAHGYNVPEDFARAVDQCPPMRSMEYLLLIRKAGLHKLPQGPAWP